MRLHKYLTPTAGLAVLLSAGIASAQDIKVGHLTYHTR